MTLYRVMFTDWSEIYIQAHDNKEAENNAKIMYTDKVVWYSVSM